MLLPLLRTAVFTATAVLAACSSAPVVPPAPQTGAPTAQAQPDSATDLKRILQFKRSDHTPLTRHALQAQPAHEASVDTLAAYLAPAHYSDLQRAWSIYVWMADRISYDVEAYLSGRFRGMTVTADDSLRRRTAVCDGFSGLYASLARRAGLEVVVVDGYAKAYGVAQGTVFHSPNHAWILLKVGQTWQVIDPTWGAGFVHGDRYHRQLDPHYFLTAAEDFKFTHWPLAQNWRSALGVTLSKQQFEQQVTTDPGLFRAGVSGAALDAVINAPGYHGLVAVYEQNHHGLQVIAIPLAHTLRQGKRYRFAIDAPAFVALSIMSGGSVHRVPRQGTVFEAEIEAEADSLLITGQRHEGGRPYGLFRYDVK